jgi:hypothetical protein
MQTHHAFYFEFSLRTSARILAPPATTSAETIVPTIRSGIRLAKTITSKPEPITPRLAITSLVEKIHEARM